MLNALSAAADAKEVAPPIWNGWSRSWALGSSGLGAGLGGSSLGGGWGTGDNWGGGGLGGGGHGGGGNSDGGRPGDSWLWLRTGFASVLSTVLIPEVEDTLGLAWGKFVHAFVVAVIHEVVDWVKTRVLDTSASVRICAWTSIGWSSLGWGVIDGVTAGAATLEGMEETEPVADFVGGGFTLLVVGGTAVRDGAGEDLAAVQDEGAIAWGDVFWEHADSEKTVAEWAVVDVEGGVRTLAEGFLHGVFDVLGVVVDAEGGPFLVDGVGCILEGEADTGVFEVTVEGIELSGNLVLWKISTLLGGVGGDDVEVGINDQGSSSDFLDGASIGDLVLSVEVSSRHLDGCWDEFVTASSGVDNERQKW